MEQTCTSARHQEGPSCMGRWQLHQERNSSLRKLLFIAIVPCLRLKKRWPKKQKHKNKCCKTCKYITTVFFILQKNLASEYLTAQWKLHAIVKSECVGLPWWRSGWGSACQCRGHGFEPWSGKIPHAVEQLGPWATTTEPARLEPVLRNKRGRYSEWPPLAATRESPRTETKTQHSHK